MIEELIVHVGMEKTGSTAIQTALDANRDSLAKAGVLYPAGLAFGSGPQLRLTGACIDFLARSSVLKALEISTPEQLAAHADQVFSEIGQQMRQRGFHRAVVSDEHLSAHASTNELIRLPRFFATGRSLPAVRPVIYLRRQDQLLQAMMSESVKSLSTRFYDPANPGALISLEDERYDYSRIIDNLTQAYGRHSLVVRAYVADGRFDVRADFQTATGLRLANPDAGRPADGAPRSNPALSAALIAALWEPSKLVSAVQTPALFAGWREFLDRLTGDFPGPRFQLTAAQSREFLARFEATNAALLSRFPQLAEIWNRPPADPAPTQPVPLAEIDAAAAWHLNPAALIEWRSVLAGSPRPATEIAAAS